MTYKYMHAYVCYMYLLQYINLTEKEELDI
jgi:hypothetical protein